LHKDSVARWITSKLKQTSDKIHAHHPLALMAAGVILLISASKDMSTYNTRAQVKLRLNPLKW
jgi:hypothetical protein